MFNYNSTPNWNVDDLDDLSLGDRLAERLQFNRLQDALIQKTLLPPVTVESFNGDPLLYRSFKYNFENTVMKVTTDHATQVSHLINRCAGEALKEALET